MSKFSDLKPKQKDSIDTFVDGAEKYHNQGNKGQKLERLNIEIPKDMHKEIKMKALSKDMTMKKFVLNAIDEYMSK